MLSRLARGSNQFQFSLAACVVCRDAVAFNRAEYRLLTTNFRVAAISRTMDSNPGMRLEPPNAIQPT